MAVCAGATESLVGVGIDARAVAVDQIRLARQCAGAVAVADFARGALRAGVRALAVRGGAAEPFVGVGIDACAVAFDQTGLACQGACTGAVAYIAFRARFAARAAVLPIDVEVGANVVALGLAGGARRRRGATASGTRG